MSDALSADSIRRGLDTAVIGRRVIYRDHLPSTNDTAHEKIRLGAPEGTVIIAGVQEQGRGRLQRSWVGPEGNVALSVILYPSLNRLPYLIMMSSLSVCRAIGDVTGLQAGIKWPNDVLLHGKKVCGILIENELHPDATAAAIVGIGINVKLHPDEYRDISATATSLETEAGQFVSRVDIIRNLLVHFDRLYTSADDTKGFEDWRDSLVTLGQPVTASWKDGKAEGIAESVKENGALNIRLADGTLHTVVAGDVTLRKVKG